MGLAQVQALLAQLYTDAALQERFEADPRGVAAAFGLTAEEGAQLTQLSKEQVSFFARSLLSKRLNGVAKLLPLTRGTLGERFGKLFEQYADTYLPRGPRRHHDDALAFATFVEKMARRQDIGPRWALDLVRYEAARLETMRPTHWCSVRRFRHPVQRLANPAKQMDSLDPPRQITLAIWFRLSPRGRLREVVLSLPERLPWSRLAEWHADQASSR
jgi:hypothetical protein